MLPRLKILLQERLERVSRRVWIAAGALLLVLGAFPFWGGFIGVRVAASVLESRLGLEVTIDSGRAGLRTLTLGGIVVREPGRRPLAVIDRVVVPFAAAWQSGTVVLEAARFSLERGGSEDNVGPLLARLAKRSGGGGSPSGGGSGPRRGPGLVIKEGTLAGRDVERGVALTIGVLDVNLAPGDRLRVDARQISGTLRVRGNDRDPRFGAGSLELQAPLEGMRPAGAPDVRVGEGYVQLLPTLGLTGIRGTVKPAGAAAGPPPAATGVRAAVLRPLAIELEGSYGGAKESLWRATGEVRPAVGSGLPEGNIALRAERFSLQRIKDVLPPSVLDPEETSVDAALDLGFADGKLAFKGGLEVSGLSLHHDAVAKEPVLGMNLGLNLDGSLDVARRRLELTLLEGRIRDLSGRLSGSLELAPGKFRFTDGSELPMLPKIELALQVPKLPCAKLLGSIPGPIVPHLQGFVLQGQFEADLRAKIDYANLEALELAGKVGIDGCKVTQAPEEVIALSGTDSITQVVEIPSNEKNAPPGTTELLTFAVGLDNPDFVPFEDLSPHLIASVMTTEDSGFFKHRGWVTSEFKTALRRNLAGGGFRLGASSITMQMVKNVLLSREKTLSRKLEELFLVWYLEQELPKERILELYFNAIEFGPRIYGIGAATRHYFGKSAAEITPLQAAFFSSILPSPKRRYIQYCHGKLLPPWEKYLRKILTRMHERGRLTDEDYAAATAETLVFDVTGRGGTEQDCLAWVKKITQRPEPEPPPEVEN